METKSKQRLIKISTSTTLLPGDRLSIKAPPEITPQSFVMIEPNLSQTKPFFTSNIVKVQNGQMNIQKNESHDPILLKKNCQAVSVYATTPVHDTSTKASLSLSIDLPALLPVDTIVKKVSIDRNLPKAQI